MPPGRNDPCPCGSGKKYKHCCGAAGATPPAQPLERARALLQAGRAAEAEPLLRRMAAERPGDAAVWNLLGLCAHHQGRGEAAVEAMARASALAPTQRAFQANLGLLLAEAGRLAESEQVLRRGLERWPQDPNLHGLLGGVLQRQGRADEALAHFDRAVNLAPQDSAAHTNLGQALYSLGRFEAARAALTRAIALDPGNAMAHNNLGNVLGDLGDGAGAIRCYEQAVTLQPGFAMAWHNLARQLRQGGVGLPALHAARQAARLTPGNPGHWQLVADAVEGLDPAALPEDLEPDLVACLARPDVDAAPLAQAALHVLRRDAAFVRALAAARRQEAIEPHLEAFDRPLFLHLLARTPIPDPEMEALCAGLRAQALACWSDPARRLASEQALRLLAALAAQCFLNEYLYGERDEERDQVEALLATASAPPEEDALTAGTRLALIACYRPLFTVPGIDALAARATHPLVQPLVAQQLEEPREELRLRETLPILSPPAGPVSLAVKRQYEENPYPRWSALPAFVGAYPLAARLRAVCPRLAEADLARLQRPRILVAGCGTGRHAAITAMLNPNAKVIAIDLSRASLAHGMRQARKLRLGNLAFAQADLLDLANLEESFDVIEAAGVLHHLERPLDGWRALLGRLAPQGFMKVALYSEAGRAAVVAARSLIAERGFAPDACLTGRQAAGIRACRQEILALPNDHPAKAVARSLDFYTLSGCRDLLFHVQEHRFTLPQIATMLDALGLEFLGFELDAPGLAARYRAEFPGDPALQSLENWAAFEERHPTTFAHMYQFWVRRAGD
ncbi:MAG: hypothetical protein KatS3mg123_2012 [Burkholderiales bacterium]|nr:MAG: hypothetical protein KatS3mg123_2012 [Burkholderiales bacterium]